MLLFEFMIFEFFETTVGMVQLLAVLFHLQHQSLDWILSQAVPF